MYMCEYILCQLLFCFFPPENFKTKYLKMVVIKKVYGHEHRIMYLTGPKLVSNFCITIETFNSSAHCFDIIRFESHYLITLLPHCQRPILKEEEEKIHKETP